MSKVDNPETLSDFETSYLLAALRMFPMRLRSVHIPSDSVWAASYDGLGRTHLGHSEAAARVAAAHDFSVLCAVLLGGHAFGPCEL